MDQEQTRVAIDKKLLARLLDGLYNGAEGMALKVIIDTDGNYHIPSRGLLVLLEIRPDRTGVERITVSNDKLASIITQEQLQNMGLLYFANSVYGVLRGKYSPYIHSLAESIVVFGRTYYNPYIDNYR